MNNRLDLIGQKFGRLKVVEFAYIRKHLSYWLCKCDCGTIKLIRGKNLRSGHTKSCGCLQKERASETHKGKTVSNEIKRRLSNLRKGEKNPFYGKNHSEETKQIMSKAQRGKHRSKETRQKMSIAKYNPNLTDEDRQLRRNIPGYAEWRKAVYERDNYTCQVCGSKKSGNIVAHHLESYNSNPKLRTTLSNGITLCKNKCHKNFHHQYGYGNNTRKQFEKFKKEYK